MSEKSSDPWCGQLCSCFGRVIILDSDVQIFTEKIRFEWAQLIKYP